MAMNYEDEAWPEARQDARVRAQYGIDVDEWQADEYLEARQQQQEKQEKQAWPEARQDARVRAQYGIDVDEWQADEYLEARQQQQEKQEKQAWPEARQDARVRAQYGIDVDEWQADEYLEARQQQQEKLEKQAQRDWKEFQEREEQKEQKALRDLMEFLAEFLAEAREVPRSVMALSLCLVKRKPTTRTKTFTVSGQTFHPLSSWVEKHDWGKNRKWYLKGGPRLEEEN